MIHDSLLELIGNTPLVKTEGFSENASIIAKLEYFNPLGSIKDRAAFAMVEDGEKKGFINKETVLIEPTSGNTGIGLAFIAAIRKLRLILTMPETMSVERRNLLSALGAELVLTDGIKGMAGAIEKAKELAGGIPNAYMPMQFDNEANPEIHYKTTGPEIWRQTDGKVDIVVAGVGTGGTVTGVGRYLKEQNKKIQIIAVEPASSPVLSGGHPGAHRIQGIGAGFVPKNFDRSVVDEIMPVENSEAMEMKEKLSKTLGILTGISSGAAMAAAVKLAERPENKGKNIVVIMPDTGERYLSMM